MRKNRLLIVLFTGVAVLLSLASCTYDYFEDETNYQVFVFLFFVFISAYGAQTYSVKGVVTSHATGEGLPFVSVGIWNTPMGTMTDSLGNYFIGNLSPGMNRIQVSSVGYKTYVSPEFRISSYDYTLDIALEESQVALSEVSVVAAPFRSSIESPIAMRVIGVQEIEIDLTDKIGIDNPNWPPRCTLCAGDRKKSGRKPGYFESRKFFSRCGFCCGKRVQE